MEYEVSPSRLEARFGDMLVEHGANREAFLACYNLVSAGELLVMIYEEALRPTGLSRDEWRILVMVEMVVRAEPRRLAEALWLGRSTVVNAVNRLEQQGLVKREQATNDRRLVIVTLTEAGRERMEVGTRAYTAAINSLEWSLSREEKEMLFRLSQRFWRDNYRRARKSIGSSPRVGDAKVE